MPKLGVNIDHIATLREVRKGKEPQPVFAALICETNGADSIVVHLREDRRHIKEEDLYLLKKVVRTKLNLEMSVAKDIVEIACKVKPHQATLVPEKRKELTTEGGLDVISNFKKVREVFEKLGREKIEVSLFIDPDKKQIESAKKIGVRMIELHTGRYADAEDKDLKERYLLEIKKATEFAKNIGLIVNAGHGLNYYNVSAVAQIKGIEELNIGYSIICRAVIVGLAEAVKEMKALISDDKY
ncbi:MAG: pyridoxine 5'-phosphate synthase [Candidatus Omnitrophica bacterium]|nr:pyridoxine 5'-phosphate synthase [Candidatus Omnitrophota bacterium]